MVVEIVDDKSSRFANKFQQKFEECIGGLSIDFFEKWRISVYHYPQTQEQYFTNEYFSGKFYIYNDKGIEIGRWNIGCFPHCCGVYTITGDYGDFCRSRYSIFQQEVEKRQNLTLLLVCFIAQYFNIPNLIAIDRRDGCNYKTYKDCGWDEMGQCKGKMGATLIYFSKAIKEINFLEEIKKLYESDIVEQQKQREEAVNKEKLTKEAALQNKNKKQASKPRASKKLIAITEEESRGEAWECLLDDEY